MFKKTALFLHDGFPKACSFYHLSNKIVAGQSVFVPNLELQVNSCLRRFHLGQWECYVIERRSREEELGKMELKSKGRQAVNVEGLEEIANEQKIT